MLPKKPYYRVSMVLKDTYSAFANALRRILIEELPVKCLDFEDHILDTDDPFILVDQLRKNINLIPIDQDAKYNGGISLNKRNVTNKIINIYASDIVGAEIPDGHIIIGVLRPGKKITISNIKVIVGLAKNDGAKFTLLGNVSYKPLGYEPFNNFTYEGKRSIEYNPTEFLLSFETARNVRVDTVINNMCDMLQSKLIRIRNFINKYKGNEDRALYTDDKFRVVREKDMYIYHIHGEYITLSMLLAQTIYHINNNVAYCAGTIDRLDTEIGIIKIIDPDPNKLMLSVLDLCEKNIDIIRSILKKK
jgi:hypothetical protein